MWKECDRLEAGVCKLDLKPCDNRMGHPMTNPELLDDGNQYLVIENHYKSESLGAYIGSTISR
jgi:hypothetical protein